VAWCCKRDGIRDEGKSIYAFQAMKSLQFQKHGIRESTSSSSFQFPTANNTVVYACVLRRKGFSWTIQIPIQVTIQVPIRVLIEDSTHHPPKQNDAELGQTFMTSQG
jgi:hypothetical protein